MDYEEIHIGHKHLSQLPEQLEKKKPPVHAEGMFSEITLAAALCASIAASLAVLVIWMYAAAKRNSNYEETAGIIAIIALYPLLWLLHAPPAIALRSRKRLGFTFLAPLIVAGISAPVLCISAAVAQAARHQPWIVSALFAAVVFSAAGGVQGYLVAVKGRSIRIGIIFGFVIGALAGIVIGGYYRKAEIAGNFVTPLTIGLFVSLVFITWLAPWVILEVDRIAHRLKYGSGLLPRQLRPLLPEIPRLTPASAKLHAAPHKFRREDRHSFDIAWRQAWTRLIARRGKKREAVPVMVIALSGTMEQSHVAVFWDLVIEALADGWRLFLVAGARLESFVVGPEAETALIELRERNGWIAVCETSTPPEILGDGIGEYADRVLSYRSASRCIEEFEAMQSAKGSGTAVKKIRAGQARDEETVTDSAAGLLKETSGGERRTPPKAFLRSHTIPRPRFQGGIGGWTAKGLRTDSGVFFLLMQPSGKFESHILEAWKSHLSDCGRSGWRLFVFDLDRVKAGFQVVGEKFSATLARHGGAMFFVHHENFPKESLVGLENVEKVIWCASRKEVLEKIEKVLNENHDK